VCVGMRERVVNSVMTNPLKKSITTELFHDITTVFYSGETRIRVETNEGDQSVVLVDQRIEYTLPRIAIQISKGVGMKDQT